MTLTIFIECRRLFRLFNALIWVLLMATIIPTIHLIPRFTKWKPGFREAALAFLCRRCTGCFNIKLSVLGRQLDNGNLVVANHISWIEIVLLLSQQPYSFIAKSEVRSWPIFGFVSRALGTFYINRHNKFSVYRALPQGQAVLKRKQSLLVFPEGTTTMGDEVLYFYPMLYELAVREQVFVQPVAICFYDTQGNRSAAAPFVGEESIIDSIMRVARADGITAELHYLSPIDASTMDRKSLAKMSKNAITDILLKNQKIDLNINTASSKNDSSLHNQEIIQS